MLWIDFASHTGSFNHNTLFCLSLLLIIDVYSLTKDKLLKIVVIPFSSCSKRINGCGMGPLLVLVSHCFRKNVVVICKIGSFLCSLDNLLQKNVSVSFLKIKFQNGAHLKKKGYFWPTFHIFELPGKVTKIPSAHILLTHIYVFCWPYWLFSLPILKKRYEFIRNGFSLVWFLVLILVRVISETINK